MRIRKIELEGFKSFVETQTFHFDEGIAGVVGPNGCGKSNVVDALKWCLGEQSAKQLRGSGMQDVIFNGSARREPGKYAQVKVTFEAAGTSFPKPWNRYEELEICRRLDREGRSAYLINQNRCRLSDVREIFLGTGVGQQLYSVIEQGRVDRFVHSNPEQRRLLFEEAAEISRYRGRRKEAQKRLERAEEQLDHSREITRELMRRLRSLERQVEKAVRFQRYEAWLRQGEVFLGMARYRGGVEDRRALTRQLKTLTRQLEEKNLDLERRDGALNGQRAEIRQQEGALEGLHNQIAELEAQRRERETEKRYREREQEELIERSETLKQEATEALSAREQAEVEREGLEQELERMRESLREYSTRYRDMDSILQDWSQRQTALRQALQKAESEVLMQTRARTRAQAELENLDRQREEAERRLSRSGKERSELEQELLNQRELRSQDAAELDDAQRQLAILSADMETERAVMRQVTERQQEAQAQLGQARQESADAERQRLRLESRLQSLEELDRSHAGLDDGAKHFLESGQALGTLAQLLEVPESLQDRLSAALRGSLDDLVFANWELLADAAEGAQSVGAVTLRAGDEETTLPDWAAGIQGHPAALAVLGSILNKRSPRADLRDAIEGWRGTGVGGFTPGGTVVTPGGEVLFGSYGSAGAQILQRKNEIQSLRDSLEAATALAEEREESLRQLLGQQEQVDTRRRQLQSRIDGLSEELQEARLQELNCQHRLDNRDSEIRREQQQLERLARRVEHTNADLKRFKHREESLDKQLETLQDQGSKTREELEELRRQERELSEGASRSREQAARVQAEVDALRQRIALSARSLDGCKLREQQASERLKRSTEGRREIELRQESLKTSLEEVDALLEVLTRSLAELSGRRDGARAGLERLRALLREAESQLQGLRGEIEALRRREQALNLEIGEIKLRLQTLQEQIQERFSDSLSEMLDRLEQRASLRLDPGIPDESPLPIEGLPVVEALRITPDRLDDMELLDLWEARVQEAREGLATIRGANLDALEEYDGVKKRYDELLAQQEDLEEAVQTIRRGLSQINRTCRRRLKRTIKQVNEHLGLLYPRLVGGGEARLEVSDAPDILDAGVEIMVRPPGKRMQTLTLLSGGEKAMTAIALIFSLFRVRPSPFCFLDEVDAPLDDANGSRFNDMLKEMSAISQFIVITHNKKTMEAMDVLYGVSMPEPGVSSLVAVKMS